MSANIALKRVLLEDAEATYIITEKLFRRVADSELLWKPGTGRNWMSVGQLLMHCASYGCGKAIRGFVTGDWGMPGGAEPGVPDATGDVPAVGALLSVESVAQALELLAVDQRLAFHCIREVEETTLLARRMTAPWGGPERALFQHLLLMIAHLAQHKGQLFYYLKLMGKDLNTGDLWGDEV